MSVAELDLFPGLLVSNQNPFPLRQGLRVRPSALCTSDFLENSQLEGDCLVQYPQLPGQSRAPALQPQTERQLEQRTNFTAPSCPGSQKEEAGQETLCE